VAGEFNTLFREHLRTSTTTVNATATDAHGNKANGSFTVRVRDTTPPAITVPADITAEATSAAGARGDFLGQCAGYRRLGP